MAGKFGIKVQGISGVGITVEALPLVSLCLAAGEVDCEIAKLKADLDATAIEMKAAISRLQSTTLFGGEDA